MEIIMNKKAKPFAVFGGFYRLDDVFPEGEPNWKELIIPEELFKKESDKALEYNGLYSCGKLHFQVVNDTLDMILYSDSTPKMLISGNTCQEKMKNVFHFSADLVKFAVDRGRVQYIIADNKPWLKAWNDKGEVIILEESDPCPPGYHWDNTLMKCVPDNV